MHGANHFQPVLSHSSESIRQTLEAPTGRARCAVPPSVGPRCGEPAQKSEAKAMNSSSWLLYKNRLQKRIQGEGIDEEILSDPQKVDSFAIEKLRLCTTGRASLPNVNEESPPSTFISHLSSTFFKTLTSHRWQPKKMCILGLI